MNPIGFLQRRLARSRAEKLLVEAGRAEEPPREAMRRAAAALGVGVGLAGVAKTTSAAAGASQWAIAKWLFVSGLGIGGLGGLVGTTLLLSPDPVPSASKPGAAGGGTVERAKQPSQRAAEVRPMPPAELEVSPREPSPSAPARIVPKAAAPSVGKVAGALQPASTPGTLGLEVKSIDAARRVLVAGKPERVFQLLDAYERRYPRGKLGQEAALLRIEALARVGQGGQARALAQRLLAQNPRSAHKKRIESLLESL
jgi:hypothetical protein